MMKKTCLSLIALFFLLIISISGAAAASGEATTLLVYLCGSDMQDAACEDLLEMAAVEAGDRINMVVLAGGSETWDLEDFKGNSRTLSVIRDGYLEQADDWGSLSMGSPESLKEFLIYGLTEFPAERTIVVLWDHGAGSEGGICFDETAGEDALTLAEINDVLTDLERTVPDRHISIFGCDACLMATYEMASMLSRHDIGYFVASEETEPGTGWNYTDWLERLNQDPAMSDEDLCGAIIESFMEAGLKENPDDYLTLSAVRLSEMSALETSMEAFASVMTGQVQSGNLTAVRQGRSRLYTFGSFCDGSWDTVDLGAALDTYAQFDASKAAEARRCLAKAVCAASQTDNLDLCCGLAVTIPQDTTDELDEFLQGIDLTGIIPNWIDFITTYAGRLQGGSYHFTASDAGVIGTETFAEDSFIASSCSPYGCLAWDDDAGAYGDETVQADEISVSEGAQGFTAVLPQEDLANLDYVEGMLLMDISDSEGEAYVDFGTMQNNLIDWKTGRVVSLYDGTWPVFGNQPVPLYDQTSNDNSRRSLIPVKLNGQYTYLVVIFPAGGTEGRIAGANAGYDENGLPIRNMTRLIPGDVIIPVYTCYYEEEGKEDLQEKEFDGEQIIWEDGMTVTYEDLSDEEESSEMMFCFVFNDIFGGDTMSEFISFEL